MRKVGDGGVRQKRSRAEGPQRGGQPTTPAPHVGNVDLLSPDRNRSTKPQFTMTDHILEVAETIQTASIVSHPSAAHDINPPTAASEKQPVVAAPASDAGSLSSDIVDPSRVIRPLRRRQTLPPLPDLRFEQSYLASLKDADTWGRVAWITVRDQVRRTYMKLSDGTYSENRIANNTLFPPVGPPPSHPRHSLDPRALRLALLEPQRLPQRTYTGKQNPQVVVWSQQLEAATRRLDQGSKASLASRRGKQ
jgi:hypothetical protein